MAQDNPVEVHLHIHEGASPEAVRSAVDALGRKVTSTPAGASGNGSPELEPKRAVKYVERAYTESSGQAKPLLEFLADNPERLIPFTEISDHLGFETARSLPGLLGSFGRRAKHRYEGHKPFDAVWDDNQWNLFMSTENADIINRLR